MMVATSPQQRRISVVTACYNEEDNVDDAYRVIKAIRDAYPRYEWEHIFIDNASEDRTVERLREIAAKDSNVRVIVNLKNFGHVRSPYYGYTSAMGDAVIVFFCDLQEPEELIHDFIREWEAGKKIVIGVKSGSDESPLMFMLRRIYYSFIGKISESGHINNFSGFGLFDKSFIDVLRQLSEPYPYFRGLVAEYGFNIVQLPYQQRQRRKGKSKNSLYSLYDSAALGIISYSKLPLRLAVFSGLAAAFISLGIALVYFVYKLLYWDTFQVGTAPVIMGIFFVGAIQLMFLGIIGEYIGVILTRVTNRPLVIEKERINFGSGGRRDAVL